MHAKQLIRQTHACKSLGIAGSTLKSAIQRGEIPTYPTECGLPLVRLQDVRQWHESRTPNEETGRLRYRG